MTSPIPQTPPPGQRMWTPSSRSRTISQAELDDFTERQMRAVAQHRAKNQALEAKLYPTERGRSLPAEQVEKSVARQVDEEMRQRERRRQELEAKYAPVPPKMQMKPSEEIEEFAKRMQDQATAAQQRRLQAIKEAQKQREREACTVQRGRSLGPQDVKQMGDRLCQPKKKLTYEEEQQRIFGKSVVLPETYVEKAKRLEAEEAAARKARLKKTQN